jgi:hypothetical protein
LWKKYFSSFLSLSWVVFHNFFFKTYLLVELNLTICLVLDYIVKQEKYFFDDFIFRWKFFFYIFSKKAFTFASRFAFREPYIDSNFCDFWFTNCGIGREIERAVQTTFPYHHHHCHKFLEFFFCIFCSIINYYKTQFFFIKRQFYFSLI